MSINQDNHTIIFHHALKVDTDTCMGCAHCMRTCPTEAIRIKSGKALIYNHKCIDCGECYRVCPVSAIHVEQDDLGMIFEYKHRVALLPAVFFGQFQPDIKQEVLHQALKDVGFTEIYEIERCVGLINKLTSELIEKQEHNNAPISTFCPAIIRLIQIRFPELVDNLIHVKPPVDVAASYIKLALLENGAKSSDIGLFYFTPCAAKIAAIKSPVGEPNSNINGVINMNSMYNRVARILAKNGPYYKKLKPLPNIPPKSLLWSLTNGEAKHYSGRCLAIDGIQNVIEFLEKMENEDIGNIDFLELRACDQSCAGGILSNENRFLTVENITRKAEFTGNNKENSKNCEKIEGNLQETCYLDKIYPRSIMHLDNDMTVAMEKMKKTRKIMCFLPGLDCGACGSPTCQALAEDIVNNDANLSHCIFLQKVMEMHKKLSPEHSLSIIESIWGKDRLDKNCKKKGAENESF